MRIIFKKAAEMALRRLHELVAGECGVLESPSNITPAVVRLLEMGLVRGSPVQMIRKRPRKGPLQIRVRNTDICLREEDAGLFLVR